MQDTAFLNRRHKLYSKYINQVKTYKACYLDEDFITDKTLPKFSKEFSKDYESRLDRAIHINIFYELVNIPFKAIFSEKLAIKREFKGRAKKLNDYIDNIDGSGTHINKIMTQLGIRALVGKQSYAYISKPDPEKQAIITPLWFDRVINWQIGSAGFFNWVCIENENYFQETPKSNPEAQKELLVMTAEYWERWNIEKKAVIEGDSNSSGLVPLIRFVITDEDDDGIGDGWGKKLVKFDKEILNTVSLYQQELYLNLFNILSMKTHGKKPHEVVKILSEHNILLYDGDTPPTWIAPNTETLDKKLEYAKWIIDMARYVAGFKGKEEMVQRAQSGIAKLFDYINTSETISNLSTGFENIEPQIWYIFAIYEGLIAPDTDYNDFKNDCLIIYPKNYDVLNLDKELENLYTYIESSIVNPRAQSIAQELITKIQLGAYLTDDELKEIKEDFDRKVEVQDNSQQTENYNPDEYENVNTETREPDKTED